VEKARDLGNLLKFLHEVAADVGLLAELPGRWWECEAGPVADLKRGGMVRSRGKQLQWVSARYKHALANLMAEIEPQAARRRGRRKKSEFIVAAVSGFGDLWRAIMVKGRRPWGITAEHFIATAFKATEIPLPVPEEQFEDWLLNRRKRGNSARNQA
jgi:hypothetical protein